MPWAQFFLIFSFKLSLSLSSFTLIKRLFSSSSLSAVRIVSSAYLRLLIFVPPILVLACNSLWPRCQQIWKTKQWLWDWKRAILIPIPKKGHAKECSNYHTTAFIPHASKVMLKILQARLQQHADQKLPDVQAEFRKGRTTRDEIANIRWIIEKAREFQKNIYLC